MVGTCNWCAHAIVGTCNCRRVHWCALVIRLVRLRRTRAILTVLTVPYLNTPYRTELLRWSRLVRSQIVQGSIVWRQHMRGACRRWKWEVLGRRGLSGAIFALAVPAPKLMQPQPSIRVVQEGIVWRQHMGGAHRGAKMGGFGVEGPS
jgi:hypothetical protein